MYRKDGMVGCIPIDKNIGWQLQFAESYGQECYDFVLNSPDGSEIKFTLESTELSILANIAVLTGCTNTKDIEQSVSTYKYEALRREKTRQEIMSKYDYDLAYQETPSGYPIEGWGIQNLENSDFEVVQEYK